MKNYELRIMKIQNSEFRILRKRWKGFKKAELTEIKKTTMTYD